MSDEDVCGAECSSKDEPCQHPANSCPVAKHSDPDAENAGRPSKYNEDRRNDVIDAAKEGKSKAGCARAAGVGKATLERWLHEHDDFRNAFLRARAQGESVLIRDGMYDPDADSSMARFLLSTSFDYIKTEKREHEHAGEGGGPLEVVIQRERHRE